MLRITICYFATLRGRPAIFPRVDPWGNLTNIGPYMSKPAYEILNAAPANTKNQLNGFCHDSAGNLLGPSAPCPNTTYTYDAENRLTATAGYTYVYDGDGKRVKKCPNTNCTGGTLYWTGTGSDPLSETGVGGTLTEEYIFFNGRRVARRDASGNAVHYYFADNLGSTSVVTDSVGTIPPQQESTYYPYGGEIVISGSDPNHYKFTGKERDTESGLG